MKAHLVSVATGIVLGIGGTLATNAPAQTSVSQQLRHTEQVCVPVAQPIVDGIRTDAAGLCAAAETSLGLGPGDCTKANVRVVSVSYDDAEGRACASVAFQWDGTLTLGTPQ